MAGSIVIRDRIVMIGHLLLGHHGGVGTGSKNDENGLYKHRLIYRKTIVRKPIKKAISAMFPEMTSSTKHSRKNSDRQTNPHRDTQTPITNTHTEEQRQHTKCLKH